MMSERRFWSLFAAVAIVALVCAAVAMALVFKWATTGSEWFSVLGYSFHKVSFLVGIVLGALVLGGGGASAEVNTRAR